MIIQFKNWEKYHNPKKGGTGKPIENASWLRLENKIFFHDVWENLSPEEFKCFVFMLCVASMNKNTGILPYNESMHVRMSGISDNIFKKTISKLYKLQIVTVKGERGRYAGVPYETERDVTERDTKVQDREKPASPALDFNALYQEYPRKEGKSRGMKICKAQIKTEEDFKFLEQAIRNYRIKKYGTESKFLMYFDTFMGEWKDWLDPETGTAFKAKTTVELAMEELKNEEEISQ